MKFPEGNFILPRPHLVLEATEHLINLIEIGKNTRSFVNSARQCFFSSMRNFNLTANTTATCEPINLPPRYILVVTRNGDEEKSLVNSSNLLKLLNTSFAAPILILSSQQHILCSLYDNLRFFKNAVGFISPHGKTYPDRSLDHYTLHQLLINFCLYYFIRNRLC